MTPLSRPFITFHAFMFQCWSIGTNLNLTCYSSDAVRATKSEFTAECAESAEFFCVFPAFSATSAVKNRNLRNYCYYTVRKYGFK